MIGGVHSIELLLDPSADAAVREEWSVLSAAGLHSLGEHQGATNAPHLTLLAKPRIGPGDDDALREIVARALPLPVQLGAPLVFGVGRRGLVLVRSVVPTAALLALHRAVHEQLGRDGEAAVDHTAPDAWTPHVTLARRLAPAGVATALEALADAAASRAAGQDEEAQGGTGPSPASPGPALSNARRWDSDAREVTDLGPARAPAGGPSDDARPQDDGGR